MKYNKVLLLYLLSFVLYAYYLLTVKDDNNINILVFWIAIIGMIASIFIQIMYFDHSKLILLQIIFLRFAIQLIYVVPHYGLFGWDPETNVYVAKLISSYGWTDAISKSFSIVVYWPILSIFSIISSSLLLIPIEIVAKWMPSVYSSSGAIFIYLISKNIFNKDKSALLSCLSLSTLTWYTEFHSWFVQEGIAYVFFLALLYIHTKKSLTVNMKIISLIFLFVLILSHHFTSLVFVLVIILFYIVQKINHKFTALGLEIFFITLGFVSIISYWIFIAPFPFQFIVNIYVEFISNQNIPSLIGYVPLENLPLRQIIIRYGNYLQVLIFGGISLYAAFVYKKSKIFGITTAMLIINIFLIFLYALSAFFPNIIRLSPNRIFIYGWLFSYILSTSLYNTLRNGISKIIITLCFIFIIFNIYSISPYIYSPAYEPSYQIHEFSFSHPLEEYKTVNWYEKYVIKKKYVIASGTNANELFFRISFAKIETDEKIFEGDFSMINKYDFIYIYDEMFKLIYNAKTEYLTKLSNETLNKYNSNASLKLIYNNGLSKLYKNG